MQAAGPLHAHEFWIEPLTFQAKTGAEVAAHLRNGEEFEGTPQPYSPRRTARAEVRLGGETRPIESRAGDLPALRVTPRTEGLMVLAYEARHRNVTYESWDKFAAFAAHKDFPDIAARHDARGLPRKDFTETYTRHCKALVGVGDGRGRDARLGLETEFVALADPYAEGLSGSLPVRLFYRDAPRADAQVEVFERAPGGEVRIFTTRTDAQGRAEVPVRPGHDYLLDAVVLREPAPELAEARGAVWETLWASLVFSVPG
ncbi:DUF4198 domain-containing protein [Roseovarius salinarum]|uniref:DUF4198 domain-containing protein n=1 Tax=Roseovarius salinarum TaxID=1981892 RepID=UPI001E482AFF|nr:DUF4198 domain-containing protein [Roseovarius salinarum]